MGARRPKSSSQQTPRWRETDSNRRFPYDFTPRLPDTRPRLGQPGQHRTEQALRQDDWGVDWFELLGPASSS
jgi:hypothetical protein